MSTTDLITQEPNKLARQDEPQSIMAVIALAAADSRVDVAKMQALLDMQFKLQARDAEIAFKEALARLLPKMPRIQKNGIILQKDKVTVRSRFAKYEDIMDVITPLMAEEGFSIQFNTDCPKPGYLNVTGTLSHRQGHSKDYSFMVPTDNPVIPGQQGVGAADSLCKRYIIVNIFNLVTVGADTDGEQPGEPKKITADQVLTIETLLADSGMNRVGFLNFFEVAKVEDILDRDFKKAITMLQAKARK